MTLPPDSIPPAPPPPPGDDALSSELQGFGEHIVEAYLDDLLSPPMKAEMERRIASDPALRAEVDLARRVDDRVRSEFAYAPPPFLPLPLPSASPSVHAARAHARRSAAEVPASGRRTTLGRRLKWYGAAAAVLLAFAGSWSAYVHLTSPPSVRFEPVDHAYSRLVEGGFTPEFVCTDDAGFRAAVREAFGEELSLPPTEGVELVGWAYGDDYQNRLLGPKTLVLMARVAGSPVIVLIDRAEHKGSPRMAGVYGLRTSSRVIGGLVVMEITPCDEFRILPLLKQPKRANRRSDQ